MRKILAVLTTAVLLSALVLPATALAARGGNDKAKSTPPGQAKKEAPVDPGKPDKGPKADRGVDALESEDGTQTAEKIRRKDRDQVRDSAEDSATAEPKRTGISNALSRIEANLARAQQQVLDGTRKALPPGLVRVYEKFMSWLGLTPEDGTPPDDSTIPDDGIDDPEGSEDGTSTPDPDDGSLDTSQTP